MKKLFDLIRKKCENWSKSEQYASNAIYLRFIMPKMRSCLLSFFSSNYRQNIALELKP